ncbi:MAG: cytochrome c-type biogenesis protein CcmH [Proteobacteria bacterium]|nr:cytochrome c-type biogenesis protein CcmH [Pseudomonadota bacterium]
MKLLERVLILLICFSAVPCWAQAEAETSSGKGEELTQAQGSAAETSMDTGLKGLLNSPAADNSIDFREVAKELRCPTCTGLSVLESDASFSLQIKNQVHEQMKMGKSKEDILKYFVERYGPWILREPPKQGFSLLAWLVPVALLCLGPIMIWLLIWRRRVQFNAHGVRSNEALIEEMVEQLRRMKETRE